MKRWLGVFTVALSTVILLIPYTPQAASPTTSIAKKATALSTSAAQPQTGGIWTIMMRSTSNRFGYPAEMVGPARDFSTPFFDRLLYIGDDGKYKPGLALSWDTSKDGKTITFKLRQGVTFHDGTPFNARAVKSNIDNLIPPKATVLEGITSVDVVDDYTVRLNLPSYNNLILFHFANNPVTWMYSPEALQKHGVDWAATHPVGTGPFMLKDYQPNISLALVKNPNYWQKGLPYLDGIEIKVVPDSVTQIIALKAGQAKAIYDVQGAVIQLRDEGYPLQIAQTGSLFTLSFDTKNSEIFSKPKVRQAIEHAIDKEAICSGPGQGLYTPVYQITPSTSPDYNNACPPRKYDPIKAKKLLAEAGYPNGCSFKLFVPSTIWKDGYVAIQNFLDKVGIKMDINYLDAAAFGLIKGSGKIEKGTAAHTTIATSTNTLSTLETYCRSNSATHQYIVKPAGIDKLIDQAKSSRSSAAIHKINQQIMKLIYEDETFIPLYMIPRIAVVDKSVQNTGWFIHGDEGNNELGTRTWLKK